MTMSTTYTSAQLGAKKVPELKVCAVCARRMLRSTRLQAILLELKLPTTGVKAELTARILEHQEKSATTESVSNGDAATSAAAAEAPVESGDAPAKQDSAPAEAAKEAGPETTQKEDGPALPAATDKGSEAEKRAARLKRFGAPAEELAKQERAARFGNAGADSIDDKVRYFGTAVWVSALT